MAIWLLKKKLSKFQRGILFIIGPAQALKVRFKLTFLDNFKPGEHTFDNNDHSKNYTIKYVGVTFDEIGILSKQVPLEPEPKIERKPYIAPLPKNSKPKIKKSDLNADNEKIKNKVPSKMPRNKVFKRNKPRSIQTSRKIQAKPKNLENPSSPLQSKVAIPTENDTGSPKIINFELDMVDHIELAHS